MSADCLSCILLLCLEIQAYDFKHRMMTFLQSDFLTLPVFKPPFLGVIKWKHLNIKVDICTQSKANVVTCKLKGYDIVHDTKCPYWDKDPLWNIKLKFKLLLNFQQWADVTEEVYSSLCLLANFFLLLTNNRLFKPIKAFKFFLKSDCLNQWKHLN